MSMYKHVYNLFSTIFYHYLCYKGILFLVVGNMKNKTGEFDFYSELLSHIFSE